MHTRTLAGATATLISMISSATALGQTGTITFTGLEFHSMGQATIATGAGGQLVVSNIGSSGQDGVRVDAEGGEGAGLRFVNPIDTSALTSLDYTLWMIDPNTRLTFPGMTVQLRPSFGGAGLDVLIANTGGDRVVEVHVIEDDVVVDGRIITAENFDPLVPVWTIGFDPEPAFIGSANGGIWKTTNGNSLGTAEIHFVEVAGGGARANTNDLRGKVLRISVKDGEVRSSEAHFAGQDLLIGGQTTYEIESATLQQFGNHHKGVGEATLHPEANKLVVGNIGSSGQDGVDIHVDDLGFSLNFEKSGDGDVDGRDFVVWRRTFGTTAATSTNVNATGGVDILHAAIGDSTRRVQCYNGQLLSADDLQTEQQTTTSPSLVAATGPLPPSARVSKIGWSIDATGMQLRTEIHFSEPVEIGPGTRSEPLMADRIVIVNTNPPDPGIDELRIRLQDGDGDDLLIVGESMAPPCPTDLHEDGVTDGQDLAALLASWNQASLADLNGDGVADGVDLAALLSAWGPCP